MIEDNVKLIRFIFRIILLNYIIMDVLLNYIIMDVFDTEMTVLLS